MIQHFLFMFKKIGTAAILRDQQGNLTIICRSYNSVNQLKAQILIQQEVLLRAKNNGVTSLQIVSLQCKWIEILSRDIIIPGNWFQHSRMFKFWWKPFRTLVGAKTDPRQHHVWVLARRASKTQTSMSWPWCFFLCFFTTLLVFANVYVLIFMFLPIYLTVSSIKRRSMHIIHAQSLPWTTSSNQRKQLVHHCAYH